VSYALLRFSGSLDLISAERSVNFPAAEDLALSSGSSFFVRFRFFICSRQMLARAVEVFALPSHFFFLQPPVRECRSRFSGSSSSSSPLPLGKSPRYDALQYFLCDFYVASLDPPCPGVHFSFTIFFS